MRPRKHADESLRPLDAVPLNSGIVDALSGAGAQGSTGVLEVTDRGHGGTARVFLFEGGLYAVDLAGYRPPILNRLRSGGRIDARAQVRLLDVVGPDQDQVGGATAVAEGWIPVEALGSLHQEYVLASLGAVLALPRARVKFQAGVVTDEFCTVPLRVDPLFDAVRLRAERLVSTWAVLEDLTDPATSVLAATGQRVPEGLSSPEFASFTAACDGQRGLDSVAHAVGFTRAEAVHVAVLLVQAGVLTLHGGSEPSPSSEGIRVPEAFGTCAPGAAGDSRVTAPVLPTPSSHPGDGPSVEPEEEPRPEPAAAASDVRRARRAQLVADLTDAVAQAEAVRDEAQSHVDELRARLTAAEADLGR
ncbi:MAG: hypothetical protein Q8M17_04260 [Actinomycetota bacterium]|nr:hypothetical protein [Actinomycetota bacterium]